MSWILISLNQAKSQHVVALPGTILQTDILIFQHPALATILLNLKLDQNLEKMIIRTTN